MNLIDATGHRVSGATAPEPRPVRAGGARAALPGRRPGWPPSSRARRQPRDDDGPCAQGLAATCSAPSRRARGGAGLLRRRRRARRRRTRARPPRRRARAGAGPLARSRARLEDLSAAPSARHAGAAGRPPDRLLPRRLAHAARPHRPRPASLGRRRARLARGARHARLRPRGNRRLRRPPKRRAGAASSWKPRDSWAWHAVAHVHEMRNAPRDGIAWLEPRRGTWSPGSFLATAQHLAPGAVPPRTRPPRRGAAPLRRSHRRHRLVGGARPGRRQRDAVAPAPARVSTVGARFGRPCRSLGRASAAQGSTPSTTCTR